jgi:hypothetical protein
MLAYFTGAARGSGDRLLVEVVTRLQGQGLRLCGSVQFNSESPGAARCDMDLRLLTGADTVRISQNLGRASTGCRLDPGALERAVGLVAATLDAAPDLLVVNKFGKQEVEGRGFRPLIGEALARGIPVLTSVTAGNRAAFLAFCDGLAEELVPSVDAICGWAEAQAGTSRPRVNA